MSAKELKGILLCGHGSRDKQGVDAFKELVQRLAGIYPQHIVDYGFLEFAHPVYAAAIERMYRKGVRAVIAVPAILFAGAHAKNDIPYEMNTLERQYEGLKIRMGKHLGISAPLLQLSKKLIEKCETNSPPADRKETCLLLVGRGTSDPDANSDVAKLTRMLWEGMGFGFASTAFIGVTTPLLADALSLVDKLPFKKVIVLPVFLFTGILLKRIHSQVEEFKSETGKGYYCTASFGADDYLLQAIDERIREVEEGDPSMNCQLCKYRTRIIGFEEEVGKEQVGHHLAVKGILFEEDEKIGTKNSPLKGIKKFLGI